MSLLTVGINHHTAPVEVRERMVFSPEQIHDSLESVRSVKGIEEAALLSTCNRTELICWHNNPAVNDALPEWLSRYQHFDLRELLPHLYRHNDADAIRHTLRVACGLDSMVLGEPQILGQLKKAYQQAQKNRSIGRHLNRLFQHSFATAKRIRTETEIGASAVSVAFAAVSLAKQIFGDLNKSTALLIGAGETIELAARHLHSQGIEKMIVANRTVERARSLAEHFNAEAIALPDLGNYLSKADIIISSTASPLPILGKGAVERALKQRKYRPMFMVDIAVPRDIEPEVNELDDVYLYTVDDLQGVIDENIQSRKAAAEQAEELVQDEVDNFLSWLRSQDHVDTIRSFRNKSELLRDEVAAASKRLLIQGKSPEEAIDYLAHSLTNKLLHDPVTALNLAAREGREDLINAAHLLFDLPRIKKDKPK